MKTYRIEDFIGGWIYGDFEPSIIKSKDTEIAILSFEAGHISGKHYHKLATEINVVLSGHMKVNGLHFYPHEIFVLHPNEISNAEFIEDTEILVIKTPSLPGDKYYV